MTDNRFSKSVETLFKILYLNFILFFLILLGLGVFGFFPSLYATVTIVRDFKETRWQKILPDFWKSYKSSFVKANIKGYIWLIVFVVIVLNTKISLSIPMLIFNFIGVISFLFTCLYLVTSFNFVFMITDDKKNFKERLINSVLISLINIKESFFQLVLVYILYKVGTFSPVVYLFGGTVVMFLLIEKLTTRGINQVQRNSHFKEKRA